MHDNPMSDQTAQTNRLGHIKMLLLFYFRIGACHCKTQYLSNICTLSSVLVSEKNIGQHDRSKVKAKNYRRKTSTIDPEITDCDPALPSPVMLSDLHFRSAACRYGG